MFFPSAIFKPALLALPIQDCYQNRYLTLIGVFYGELVKPRL
jgi:hypothetical protein